MLEAVGPCASGPWMPSARTARTAQGGPRHRGGDLPDQPTHPGHAQRRLTAGCGGQTRIWPVPSTWRSTPDAMPAGPWVGAAARHRRRRRCGISAVHRPDGGQAPFTRLPTDTATVETPPDAPSRPFLPRSGPPSPSACGRSSAFRSNSTLQKGSRPSARSTVQPCSMRLGSMW